MTEQVRNDIVSRWRAQASIRQIARDLGLSRNTVSGVVRAVLDQRDGTTSPRPRRPRRLDAYAAVVQELLARYPDLTATRLWQELRQRGFSGGYTVVRQVLQELRPKHQPRPVVRFETGPGAQAQMDYATYDLDFTQEGRRRVYAFSYVLGYSRRQYVHFVSAQDLDTTLREHVRAFDHLGGVAATCLYDNMKVVVSRYEDKLPIYNLRFLAFATHYGFKPLACRPHRPQTKGKVERPFYYVQTNLLNGRTFATLDHLNDLTAWWLANVADVRVHSQTKKTPQELHTQEQPHLIALPAQPYELYPVCYRVVNVEGFIVYRQNRYSVPWQHIGRTLPVRVREAELIIYDPHLQELTRHPLFAARLADQCSAQPGHRPAEEGAKRQVQLQERFADWGEVALRFLEGLRKSQRQSKEQAQRLLALLASYRHADVCAALERAVRYGAYSYQAVERILAVQAKPRSVLETLADDQRRPWQGLLGDPPVPPRPTTDYRPLFSKDNPDDTTQERPGSAKPPADGAEPEGAGDGSA